MTMQYYSNSTVLCFDNIHSYHMTIYNMHGECIHEDLGLQNCFAEDLIWFSWRRKINKFSYIQGPRSSTFLGSILFQTNRLINPHKWIIEHIRNTYKECYPFISTFIYLLIYLFISGPAKLQGRFQWGIEAQTIL